MGGEGERVTVRKREKKERGIGKEWMDEWVGWWVGGWMDWSVGG